MTTGLFVGRFQPFHRGHLATVKFALKYVGGSSSRDSSKGRGGRHRLVIVVGSAQKSHEPRNPFTAGERIAMIKDSLDADSEVDAGSVLIIPVPDVDVHSLWTRQVDMLVPRYDVVFANDPFTGLLFRERGVKVVEAPLHDRGEMSGTEIRRRMAAGEKWEELVPAAVARTVREINGIERVRAIAEKEMQDGIGGSRHSLERHLQGR